MSDPRRLLEEVGDGPALLRSACHDQPPAGGKARLLATIGVAAGATTATATATAAGATAGTATAGATTTLVLAGKVVVLGLAVAAVAAGAVEVARPKAPPASKPAVAMAAPTVSSAVAIHEVDLARPTPAPELPSAPTPVSAAPAPIDAPPRPARESSPAPVTTTAPAGAPSDNPLASELSFIDVARGALARGEPADALTALNAYDLRFFQRPRLAEEAAVLRIEALVDLGRTDEARRVADRFLRADPASPYAKRVRSLVHESDVP
jgi:hypothetical protein